MHNFFTGRAVYTPSHIWFFVSHAHRKNTTHARTGMLLFRGAAKYSCLVYTAWNAQIPRTGFFFPVFFIIFFIIHTHSLTHAHSHNRLLQKLMRIGNEARTHYLEKFEITAMGLCDTIRLKIYTLRKNTTTGGTPNSKVAKYLLKIGWLVGW